MKPIWSIITLAASLAAASAAEESGSTVRFSNGDQLGGDLGALSIDHLEWKSSVLEQPASFLLDKVLDMELPGEQPLNDSRHEASITLMNGDLVRGQLAGVSEQTIELDTWFAGRLKFNRLMVSDIKIEERPDLIYRGPTGLDGWKRTEPLAWTFQNSGFRSTRAGSIARDVNLPDVCSVAFDLTWRNSVSFNLVLFSNDLATERPSTGYQLTFQQRSISFRNCKNQKFLGHTPNAVALQEGEKARIEVKASLKTGKVCVFIDGQLVDQPWIDPDVAKLSIGRGIHFVSMKSSPLQVSRIEVGAWDGEVEQIVDPQLQGGLGAQFAWGVGGGGVRLLGGRGEEAEEPPAPEKPSGQRMELRNGDSIAGEVKSIDQGMITVKTPFRDVKLPIEALRSVALKPVDLERCKRENGDVRAWFPDGSSIVFRMDAVDGGVITGYSQNFGVAKFRLEAFSRIEFNIYNPNLDEIRIANGW